MVYVQDLRLEFKNFSAELCKGLVPDVFMFHGAPDILITKSRHVNNAESLCDYSSLSDNEDISIENCLQRPPIKHDDSGLPEKIGEVLAASQFLLVCKVIRKLRKGKALTNLTIKSMLVNKIAGIICCTVTGSVVRPSEKKIVFK